MENDLNTRREQNISNITHSTQHHLQKKGLTLSSLRYNNTQGKHVVIEKEDEDDSNDNENLNVNKTVRAQGVQQGVQQGVPSKMKESKDARLHHRPSNKYDNRNANNGRNANNERNANNGRNERNVRNVRNEQKEQNEHKENKIEIEEDEDEEDNDDDDDDDDDDDEYDEDFVSSGMLRVSEARLDHYIQSMERNGFVNSISFVKSVTRHFVLLCHRFQGAIAMQQMLMMPAMLPRTVAGFQNPAAGIESVFGTMEAYFESRPIAQIMYLDKHNTVHLKSHLQPGDIERAINSI